MKIAVLSLLQGKVQRGAENWAENLKRHLEGAYQVDIFGAQTAGISLDLSVPQNPNALSRRLFLDYWSLKSLILVLKLISKLKEYNLIIPINGGLQSVLVRLITWIYKSKMVIFGHSGPGWDDRVNLWAFPDCFVALSRVNYHWARRVNPFVSVIHIPIPVDLDKFSPIGPKAEVSLSKPIILAVGAAIPTKRLDLTIKAVAKLKTPSLLLISSGPDAPKLDHLGKSLLGPRYKRIPVSADQIQKYYRTADVFTLTPWANESFPVVYLEALATNLPVVASDHPARREAVGPAGLYVNPTDAREYSSALAKALSTNWGRKPLQQAKLFSWQRLKQKYQQLFADLCSQ